jgi:LPXTG-motif cell wall-anchored protein
LFGQQNTWLSWHWRQVALASSVGAVLLLGGGLMSGRRRRRTTIEAG